MIAFEDVTFTHSGALRPTLTDVNLHIGEGDLCLVVGRTGTGKSTLLGAINGLVPHFTGGTLGGEVSVAGRSTRTNRPRDLADLVGFVGQNPELSFVTDTVADEIAYGMEQLGVHPAAMRKRVEETLDVMGIAELRHRPLADLSGGQQQRVAIASVLAAHPRVLVLDEPTSALDPTAAADVLAAITALVHDAGLTVVLAEHRLERVMHAADHVLWLPGDGSVDFGDPADVLSRADVRPPLAQLAGFLGWDHVPTSVRDARRRLARERPQVRVSPSPRRPPATRDALVLDRLDVRYGPIAAIRGISARFPAGQVCAIMGRNGSGKSSLLWAIQGGVASTGDVDAGGQDPRRLPPRAARTVVSLVPQTPGDLLYQATVAAECERSDAAAGADRGATAALLARLGGDVHPQAHPRDLSEGQRLLLVLAIQLAAGPAVVLLDEPTRGLDYLAKERLTAELRGLADQGVAVIVSTHDVEFATAVGDLALVLGDGEIVAQGTTREVCGASPAFAPQVAKVFAPADVLTLADLDLVETPSPAPAKTPGRRR